MRGTSWASGCTRGKLEILKLREDYRKLRCAAFDLQQFHDTFLQGFPPIKIVRRDMLGNDSASGSTTSALPVIVNAADRLVFVIA